MCRSTINQMAHYQYSDSSWWITKWKIFSSEVPRVMINNTFSEVCGHSSERHHLKECSFKKQELVEQWHFRAPGEIKGWFLKKNGPWNIEMNVHFYHFKSKACWLYCPICLEITKLIITTLLHLYKVRTKHSYSVMHTVEVYYVAKGNYLFTCTALKGA